jgi:hypothetical protein
MDFRRRHARSADKQSGVLPVFALSPGGRGYPLRKVGSHPLPHNSSPETVPRCERPFDFDQYAQADPALEEMIS